MTTFSMMVGTYASGNVPVAKTLRRHVFPHPPSPTITTFTGIGLGDRAIRIVDWVEGSNLSNFINWKFSNCSTALDDIKLSGSVLDYANDDVYLKCYYWKRGKEIARMGKAGQNAGGVPMAAVATPSTGDVYCQSDVYTSPHHLDLSISVPLMQARAHVTPQTDLETFSVPVAKDFSYTSAVDAGCSPSEYYRSRMSPIRFALRQLLLSLVEKETAPLGRWQAKVRTPSLDAYFSLTATLGSHTFYVLMLPIPIWFGYFKLARDLVFLLGFGIYFSGLLKDYLCLPRPKSPPLHRITRSHYTAQEYGCPSSHSANAISVTLTLATYWYHHRDSYSSVFNIASIIFSIVYFVSLVLGRLYCGMHGFVDISSGLLIGLSCFLIRHLTSDIWDHIVFKTGWFCPILVVVFYYSIIYFHVEPIDDCPCFEDSVAFVGVLIGMELGQWALLHTSNAQIIEDLDFRYNVIVPFSWTHLGPFFTLARLVLGVSTIVIWKAASKPLLTRLLSPITPQRVSHHCKALQSRTHVYIFVRLAVYAGISTLTVWMNVWFNLFGLSSPLSGPLGKYM